MWHVYKIITRSCHTYIGQTTNPDKRFENHRYWINRGRLGYNKIPPCQDPVIEILFTELTEFNALIVESRFIAQDILNNPKNCNKRIGHCNSFGNPR
jgi:hypothetical protein